VLDACRDNPYLATRSAARGLAEMRPAEGSLIAYAADRNQTAADNPRDQNGLFTSFFVEALMMPGLTTSQVFDYVRERVVDASNGRQRPSVYTNVTGRFQFNFRDVSACDVSASSPEPHLVFRKNPVDGAEYSRIPAGRFIMGCVGERDCAPERRAEITLEREYWIMRTEVTAQQYRRFVNANPGRNMPEAPGFNPEWKDECHPISNVTWFEARDYCCWAGGRLPSDAEWERAARATHDWRFEWGPNPSPTIEGRPAANLLDDSHIRKYGSSAEDAFSGYDDKYPESAPVGRSPQNDLGLFDMTGNVTEWVADKGLDTPDQSSQPRDGLRWVPRNGSAWEGGDEFRRVLRPSNWSHGLSVAHVYDRLVFSPYGKASVTGFRCARDSPP
jgi:formylglycine-generating enzyme required for sulfatase activity